MKNALTKLACLAAVVLSTAATGMAQTVRLRDKATIPTGDDVRLGNIATISGTDNKTAERLADTIIVASLNAARTIKAENVLMAVISQHGPGGVANRLQIVGSATCDVITGAADTSTAPSRPQVRPAITDSTVSSDRPIAMAAVMSVEPVTVPAVSQATAVSTPETAPISSKTPAPVAAKSNPSGKLSQLLIDRMTQENSASEDTMRITFETISPLLDVAATPGQRWQIRPLIRSTLGTVQFEAQLIEGTRVVQKVVIQMKVLLRANVLVAAAPINRGDVVTKDHFRVEETWLDRKMPTLVLQENDVVGMEATRAVATGASLDQRDFRAVEMVLRGEVLTVYFVSGGLKVQAKARAMENGRLHAIIKVRNDSTNEIYQATLIGKSLAITGGSIDAETEKLLREGH